MEIANTTATLTLDTSIVYDRLVNTKVGEIVSYDELTSLVKRDIKIKDRYILQSAIRKCLSHNLVFGNVRNVGVKRLSDEEICATGSSTISRTGRMSRRGIKKLASVRNFNELPKGSQIKHNAAMSILGMISHATRRKQVAAIEQRASYAQDKLSLRKTIEAISGTQLPVEES